MSADADGERVDPEATVFAACLLAGLRPLLASVTPPVELADGVVVFPDAYTIARRPAPTGAGLPYLDLHPLIGSPSGPRFRVSTSDAVSSYGASV